MFAGSIEHIRKACPLTYIKSAALPPHKLKKPGKVHFSGFYFSLFNLKPRD